MKPTVTAIVAYNERFVIGNNMGKVPWHIPDDMKFFKEITMKSPVVMGRKTWDSIPDKFRPLPGRYNIIVTKSHRHFPFPEGRGTLMAACDTVETAIALGKQFTPTKEVFITGGAQVYAYCIDNGLVDRVLASEIKNHVDVEGATFFPNLKELGWVGKVYREFDQFTVMEYRRSDDKDQCNSRNEGSSDGSCSPHDGEVQKQP